MTMIVSPLATPTTFEAFCDAHGLQLIARERPKHYRLPRWYVSAPSVEIHEGQFLASLCGDGDTPEAARDDYARQLAGRHLVVDAYHPTRREIVCPNEWLPAE